VGRYVKVGVDAKENPGLERELDVTDRNLTLTPALTACIVDALTSYMGDYTYWSAHTLVVTTSLFPLQVTHTRTEHTSTSDYTRQGPWRLHTEAYIFFLSFGRSLRALNLYTANDSPRLQRSALHSSWPQ
jgi:hypothetical protein